MQKTPAGEKKVVVKPAMSKTDVKDISEATKAADMIIKGAVGEAT